MSSIPNVVSGRVTHRAERPASRTPNWLKALYAVLATILAIFALAIAFGPDSPPTAPTQHHTTHSTTPVAPHKHK